MELDHAPIRRIGQLTELISVLIEFASVDATDVTKNKQFKSTVCATSAGWRHDSRAEKRSFVGTSGARRVDRTISPSLANS
jgi:hypothetical protein